MVQKLFIFLSLFSFIENDITLAKEYHYEYYTDGTIKSEGWKLGDNKVDFWHFYYPNGKVSSEGHYINNQKHGYWYFYSDKSDLLKEGHFINDKAEKWWIIYDIAAGITKKYQYKNNKKEGFCLLYKNNKLFKAEKYINNMKTGEWTDIFSFKRDNPNASL
ncbi:hypothetical protein [Aquimarina sp. 2201CG5-10]|uniref:toxin-antitoxin system YwqK family antitoxin n=1 Tax=Aquimarina callyspongiae TaxID=3098150 RepID=UPI002AB5A2D7|nr:hypothetical protein [Aquimarina sp. 2201CG5-10]MDY8134778.1 hypothetical protein [Aquimarina sp. 2201CG5-10]